MIGMFHRVSGVYFARLISSYLTRVSFRAHPIPGSSLHRCILSAKLRNGTTDTSQGCQHSF